MVINSVISVFIYAIGGPDAYYSLFSLVFLVGIAAIFYKISTL